MEVTHHEVLDPGDVVAGKYVLRERIGEGGMGMVFLADHPALARTVAIKILHPRLVGNHELALRFREEAVAASRVRHPCSVSVIDCDVLRDGTPFIVMEHVRGRPLARIVAEQEVPIPRAIELVTQILHAIDAVHCSGVVHADVKSDNFLVDEGDGSDHVTLIDFGLARLEATPGARTAGASVVVSGTPEYMAPEVVLGSDPSPASDLYAVGVILYELLTGVTPFSGGTADEIMARQVEELVIAPSLRKPARAIPTAIDQVVARALDKRPEARFADAAEFARTLHAVAQAHAGYCTACGSILKRDPSDLEAAASSPRTVTSTRPHRQFARAVTRDRRGLLDELRRAIGDALVVGDVTLIADGYVKLAASLAADRQFAAAARELEEGIDVLAAGAASEGSKLRGPLDRLLVALAALYDESGQRQRARRTAAAVDHHPTLTSSIT